MFNEKTYLFATCKECGKRWNISVFQQIPNNGYICPYCRGKAKREQGKLRNGIAAGAAKYLILTLIGIILYLMTAEAAYIQRGYRACGGELAFLLLPLWWFFVEVSIRNAETATKQNYYTEVMKNE